MMKYEDLNIYMDYFENQKGKSTENGLMFINFLWAT